MMSDAGNGVSIVFRLRTIDCVGESVVQQQIVVVTRSSRRRRTPVKIRRLTIVRRNRQKRMRSSTVESEVTRAVIVVVASRRHGRGGESVGLRIDVFLWQIAEFGELTGVARMPADRLAGRVGQCHAKDGKAQLFFGLET